MATFTTTGGAQFGAIPLDTLMVDKDAVVEIVSGSASGVVDTVSGMIASAVSTAWKAGGSKAPSDLTSSLLVAANEGKVYNMSASGTTDANFMEGSGKPYLAGTDIAVINDGTAESPVYKFNVLAAQDSSVVKSVNGYTPTNGAVTLPNAVASGQTGAKDGLMSSGDKYKLDNIASGAEVNQNAFSNIAVSGESTVAADSKTDTLTLVAGNNVTITTNAEGDSITISSSLSGAVRTVRISGTSGNPSLHDDFSADGEGIVDLSGRVVASFVTDSGTAKPVSGVADIHGANGVAVNVTQGAIIVDAAGVSGVASGAASGVAAVSGIVSGLKNFSKVTVKDSSGNTVTNGEITPANNSDTGLGIKAGDNVSLSTSGKNVVISATGSVVGAKVVSGGTTLDTWVVDTDKKIIAPLGSYGDYGVVKFASAISGAVSSGPSEYAASVALVMERVKKTVLDENVTLVANDTAAPAAKSGNTFPNTIYGLISALKVTCDTAG